MWLILACARPPSVPPASAPAAVPPIAWQWWSPTVHGVALSLCVPAAPERTGGVEEGGVGILDARSGAVLLEIIASTVGVFPLSANVPDAYSAEVLVASEQATPETWWLTTRDRDGGAARSLVARIPDEAGEDVLCRATADLGPGRSESELFALLARVCRSMRLGAPTGGCPSQ